MIHGTSEDDLCTPLRKVAAAGTTAKIVGSALRIRDSWRTLSLGSLDIPGPRGRATSQPSPLTAHPRVSPEIDPGGPDMPHEA
ncbi:hypothetical protein AAFF_G00086870 [Aldrovandia affinis]|uniref:Uncharacterized protein n=1 Tax=Aldrovandia affinis TaxID=143900 RepID=A0AAD7WC86_9TELE|nr:hypothetical protein AAFF_G00086870 [Aldrovandia affinis]